MSFSFTRKKNVFASAQVRNKKDSRRLEYFAYDQEVRNCARMVNGPKLYTTNQWSSHTWDLLNYCDCVDLVNHFLHCYRLQRRCGKVIFSQVSAILSTGGGVSIPACTGAGTPPWQTPSPWADTHLGRPPWADTPLPSACWDTPRPPQRPLLRMVRILLECILVIIIVALHKSEYTHLVYSTAQYSMISSRNHNSWVNRRCDWTISTKRIRFQFNVSIRMKSHNFMTDKSKRFLSQNSRTGIFVFVCALLSMNMGYSVKNWATDMKGQTNSCQKSRNVVYTVSCTITIQCRVNQTHSVWY